MVLHLLFGFFYLSGDAFTSRALHATSCTFSKGTFGGLTSLLICVPYSWVKTGWGGAGGAQSLTALGVGALRFKW